MEKSIAAIKAKVPISDTGMVNNGMSMALQFCRKIRITSNTRIKAIRSVSYIPAIEARINSVVSRVTLHSIPSGK